MAKFIVPNQAIIHRWMIKLLVFTLARKLGVRKYTIGGSYRRGKWFCNDIDLVIPIKSEFQKNGLIVRMEQLGWRNLNKKGEGFANMWTEQFIKKIGGEYVVLDLFLVDPGSMGNALVFTTGPKSFNDKIRGQVLSSGYSWANPKYFKHLETDEKITFDTEKAVFNFLGLRWINPKNRI
jgi:DNA polymerase/3'-5' exonuclease PolX